MKESQEACPRRRIDGLVGAGQNSRDSTMLLPHEHRGRRTSRDVAPKMTLGILA